MITKRRTTLVLALTLALCVLLPTWARAQRDPDSHEIKDTVPPVAAIPPTNSDGTDNGPTGSEVTATSMSINFDSTDPPGQQETFMCRFDGGAAPDGHDWQACSSPYTHSGLSVKSHTFEVRATDSSGNTGNIAVRNWTQVSAAAPVSCTGTNIIDIYPDGDPQHNNFGAVVTNNNADGVKETFCVHDGTHTVTQIANLGQKDEVQGEYSDSTRPQLVGNGTVTYIINSAKADGVDTRTGGPAIKGVTIRGAATDSTCSTSSGRGIGAGGSYMTIENVRIADNAGSGLGATGDNLLVLNSLLENNVNDPCYVANGVSASGANIKTTNSFRFEQSTSRESHWDGIWCDLDCDTGGSQMQVVNSTVVDNMRSGVHYEVTASTPNALVQNNTIQGNGWKNDAAGRTVIEGEVLIVSSSGITVSGNLFGETGTHLGTWGPNFNAAGRVYAVVLKQDTRGPGITPSTINVSGNTEQDVFGLYPPDTYSCTYTDARDNTTHTVACS